MKMTAIACVIVGAVPALAALAGCAGILWQALFVEGGMPSASFAGHAVTHAGNMPTQQRRGHATLATNMRCAPLALMAAAPGREGEAAAGRLLIVADEARPMQVLAEFLKAEGGYASTIVDPKDLPADFGGYEAVFMYIHGPMQPATERALVGYAQGGGRLVLLHHAVASARLKNPEFLRLVGVHIPPRDDPRLPWRVIEGIPYVFVNLAPRHYITTHKVTYDRTVEYQSSDAPSAAGQFPAFELAGTEVFLNQHFTDGRAKTVLAGFRVVDPKTGAVIMQDRAAWYKPAGRGWVFYFQPGHRAEDFANRNYAQMILNSLTWKPGMEAR